MPNTQNQTDVELTPEQTAQLHQVQQLLMALEKTTRAQKLYLANNQILLQHRDKVNQLFKQYLAEHAELVIQVQIHDFIFLGQSVYHNANSKESFAFRLYNEGMRSVRFLEGLTPDELDEFMKLLNSDESGGNSNLLLWERDFQHIHYVIAEYLLEDAENKLDEQLDQVLDPGMQHYSGPTDDTPSEEIEQGVDVEGLMPEQQFKAMAKNICVLENHEFEQIQREIANGEKHERLRVDLFDILMTLILEERDPNELEELYQIILETIDASILNGELNIAAQFVMALRNQLEGGLGDFALRHPDRILRVLESLGQQDRVLRYLNSLNVGFSGSAKDIMECFSSLPKKAFATLLGHIHVVASPQLRKELAIATSQLYDRDISHFIKAFKTIKAPQHLLDVLLILSQTRDSRGLEYLEPVLHVENRNVKLAAINTVKELAVERGKALLLGLLEDSDEEIRSQAARALARLPDKSVGMLFFEKIQGDSIHQLNLREKGSYFYAAAKILGDDLIPYLSKLLNSGSLFRRQAMDEIYQCAAHALKSINSDSALQTLKHFEANGNKSVKLYCSRELKRG